MELGGLRRRRGVRRLPRSEAGSDPQRPTEPLQRERTIRERHDHGIRKISAAAPSHRRDMVGTRRARSSTPKPASIAMQKTTKK